MSSRHLKSIVSRPTLPPTSAMSPSNRLSRNDLIAVLVLSAAVALLFLGAPRGGAFYWSDAPRHALNGVFVMDFLRAAPIHDPAGFAYRYYAQYPALTILLYPPLFYLL